MSRDVNREDFARKSPAELQADIERTRARISGEVDALGDRLSPSALSEDAKEVLHGTQDASFNALEELGQSLVGRSQRLSTGVVDFLKRNPAPTTLLGFGFAWLLMRSSRPKQQQRRR